ncbi:MAG TPA: phosphoribosylformylglycinamidine synthase I [Pirellulales bacterium]|jgi:phosphoribosylformylglycinamidine synthase|nr:phosphoribosylformylglycinamidine synthase I [Pirellulales bacterium]
MPPRVLILRAPGTNCDGETAFAFEQAGGTVEALHVNRVLENPRTLERFQILCLPGGFSYGDDLSAGRILGSQLRLHLGDRLREFQAAGKLVLGICNGFQVLIKSGLLFSDEPNHEPPATLTNNDSGHFEARWIQVRRAGEQCVFLRGIEHMDLPIAHGEGKFVARSPAALEQLERAGQLCLRYAGAGECNLAFPENPNGSQLDVAGMCDASGRVFGLMPHPERHIDRTQHPRWTRRAADATGDGLKVFQNAVNYFG